MYLMKLVISNIKICQFNTSFVVHIMVTLIILNKSRSDANGESFRQDSVLNNILDLKAK